MSISKFLESKRGKALIGIVCSFAVICVTVTGLLAGGLFKAKDSVPEKTTEKAKTTEYEQPMFRTFQQ